MSVGKFTCKYWAVCGSRENCTACQGYELKGQAVEESITEGQGAAWQYASARHHEYTAARPHASCKGGVTNGTT